MGNNASHNIKSTMDKCSASHYTSWFTGVSFMYASWLLVAFAEGREHCTVRRPLSGPLHGDISAPVFPLFCVILCVCVKSHKLSHLPFALVASERATGVSEWSPFLLLSTLLNRSSAPVRNSWWEESCEPARPLTIWSQPSQKAPSLSQTLLTSAQSEDRQKCHGQSHKRNLNICRRDLNLLN